MTSDAHGFLAALILVAVVAFWVGTAVGSQGQQRYMERMLVDSPDTVAAIRSRVLAERAEKAARK